MTHKNMTQHIEEAIDHMIADNHVMESGTISYKGKTFCYKINEVKN